MKDIELVQLLLNNGADVNIGDENGTIPLHIACKLDQVAIGKILIDANSNINTKGQGKNTPLHYASHNMNKTLVEILIKKGASAREKNDEGRTPLQGVRLTFAKFMRQLLGDEKKTTTTDDSSHVEPGDILNQASETFDSFSELKDAFCLLCRRRAATAALLPCGHLCVCEQCQKERVSAVKTCPICKQEVYGAVSILAES
ncbi:hypothetical protein TRFO_30178 [Tritrichomonas foetus]|uniref:RING-type domain-containing protein n=1 Tax=Tritrichomonas foetus TaxID=1144522 RepID=A0A1J4JW65_9EUKA|nr:hypothetical protein TRFO_30178 [Tritrichomonas foetus]|eukprot:OHT02680.1 hypothetical protein TRFO_30178 [Tritrichomonas foetus]